MLNVQSSKFNVLSPMFNVQCSKFKIQYSKSNHQSPKFNVQSSKFNVQRSKFKIQCSVFNVQCSKFNVHCSMFNVGGSAWVGGWDIENNNIYKWLDTTAVSSGFTNWHTTNPDHGTKNYMEILFDDWRWGDLPGTLNRKYICQAGMI